jgi:hypothetical protein
LAADFFWEQPANAARLNRLTRRVRLRCAGIRMGKSG